MSPPRPSLATFERHVAAGQQQAATDEAVRILHAIDAAQGSLAPIDLGAGLDQVGEEGRRHQFASRFAAAFGELMCQPGVTLSGWTIEALFVVHRWIDIIFALCRTEMRQEFRSRLATSRDGQRGVGGEALPQFLLLSSPSEGLEMDLDACFAANPGLTLVAALGYLANWYCVTPRAREVRERLLEWAPGRLGRLAFGGLRLARLADVYMTCSYASGAGKHRIKSELIGQARVACVGAGCREMTEPPPPRSRPRIVVVTERLEPGHSQFRMHFSSVRPLRQRFEVIGVFASAIIDETVLACFDHVIIYSGDDFLARVRGAAAQILAWAPDIVFHIGVGLRSESIALASLRLAPVQCASFGHAATTLSPVIDWMVVPDDFVGSESRFSERLLRLPAEAMPCAAPAASHEPPRPPPTPIGPVAPLVRIAIPASAQKINSAFLAALAQISARAKQAVEFVFLPLGAIGLAHSYLEQEIGRILPNAVVHAEAARQTYLERLGGCAFFLCPFPYGNMNGIIDAAVMGLPGVCLDGEELHAHADVAIFRRLSLPDALATSSVDAYVAAAVRLIDDEAWLAECRKAAGDIDLERQIYTGDESLFCDALYGLTAAGLTSRA